MRGVMWFFVVVVAYGAGPLGYLLHLICAASAACPVHIPANGADAGGVDGGSIALRYISELRRNAQMIEANTIIGGRYRVTRPLGGGGMKMVYLAEDLRLASRPCALAEMVDSFTDPDDAAAGGRRLSARGRHARAAQ